MTAHPEDARTDADVVVIGAGLSGLSAASALTRAGRSVIVLEARERVGGRTLSGPLGRGTFDFGGQWIGPSQQRVRGLIRELGLSTHPTWTHGRKAMVWRGEVRSWSGELPDLSLAALVNAQLAMWCIDHMQRQVPADAPHLAAKARDWDTITVEQWKRRALRAPGAAALVDVVVRSVFSCEPAELSMLYFLSYVSSAGHFDRLIQTENGAQQDRIVGGAQQLSERLARALPTPVVHNAPVDTIDQTAPNIVRVCSGTQSWTARRVIVAMAPALTARLRILPEPPSDRIHAAQRSAMGSTVKCLATYPTPFWRDAGFSGEAIFHEPDCPLVFSFDNSTHDSSQAALVAFVVGRHARGWSARDPDARRHDVLTALARVFGPQALNAEHYHEHDWCRDPWSWGCPVSTLGPGVLTSCPDALRRPIDRIHWAGTETATVWAGFLDGAIEAGERACGEVLDALRL